MRETVWVGNVWKTCQHRQFTVGKVKWEMIRLSRFGVLARIQNVESFMDAMLSRVIKVISLPEPDMEMPI